MTGRPKTRNSLRACDGKAGSLDGRGLHLPPLPRILHLSNSPYSSLKAAGPSLPIFRELARDTSGYHVLAPADGRPRRDREGVLHLHTLPGRRGKTFAVMAFPATAALVGRHRIDGIVAQDPLLGGLAGVEVGRLLGVPTLIELHTDLWSDLASRRGAPHLRALGAAALHAARRATLVRTSGPRLTARLVAAGIDPERLREVPYRVDVRFFDGEAPPARPPARPLAVSVGRFVPQKGYLELLDAVAQVPELRLVLAGGGPLESALRARIGELGVGDRVALRTWISRDEQRALLAEADLYLQPSIPGLGDWMPRTILEAMAMALPILATDVGGIPDVVRDACNGVLVARDDPAALVEALERLTADPALREKLGAEALRTARAEFAWDVAFDRYRAVLSELVTHRPQQ